MKIDSKVSISLLDFPGTVLLKLINLEFIQMKHTILDDNISDHWKEILDFIDRQHIDEDENRKNNLSGTVLISNKYNTI